MEITLTITNRTTIRPLFRDFTNALKKTLALSNPQWVQNNQRGYSNKGVPSHLCCFTQGPEYLDIPRGFTRQAMTIATEMGIECTINDHRRLFPPLGLKFQGNLRPYQQEAIDALLTSDFATLNAPTGSGKTVVALALAAIRDQPFTVIVHTSELLDQWVERAKSFLSIKPGVVAKGKFNIGKEGTIALVQTLYKDPYKVVPYTGFLITDEVHRCPARMFRDAVATFDCKYMLGASATPYRQDGLTGLIHWYIGEEVHEIERQGLEDEGSILKAVIISRETDFQTNMKLAPPRHSEHFDWNKKYDSHSAIISALVNDNNRNSLIINDILNEASGNNGICLVLTDRKEHAYLLRDMLSGKTNVACLTGDTKERSKIVEDLNSGQIKVLVATGQLIGEGFDCKGLSTLFLTTPVKFGGRLVQYLGRVLRPGQGKEMATIYDYVDVGCPVLMRAYRSRRKEYKSLKWKEIKT